MGMVVSEKPCWVRRVTRRSWDKRPDWGRPGTVLLEDITKQEGFAVGVTEERKETKFSEGGEGDGRHIYSYRFRGGKNSA
jgi:hypothetical protein